MLSLQRKSWVVGWSKSIKGGKICIYKEKSPPLIVENFKSVFVILMIILLCKSFTVIEISSTFMHNTYNMYWEIDMPMPKVRRLYIHLSLTEIWSKLIKIYIARTKLELVKTFLLLNSMQGRHHKNILFSSGLQFLSTKKTFSDFIRRH